MGFAPWKFNISADKIVIYAPIDSGWSALRRYFGSLASKSAVKAVNCSSLSFKISWRLAIKASIRMPKMCIRDRPLQLLQQKNIFSFLIFSYWPLCNTKVYNSFSHRRVQKSIDRSMLFRRNGCMICLLYTSMGWGTRRAGEKARCKRNGAASGVFPPGGRGRIPEVCDVSALSADQCFGEDLAIYPDCGRVRGGSGRVFPLPWRTEIWRQHPGDLPGSPLFPCVGRLPDFSSGADSGIKTWKSADDVL